MLVKSLNVGKNMSADQIKMAAPMIYESYNHLKPEDIALCFKNIIRGKYGPIYDRIDVSVILDALAKYEAERDEAIVDFNIQQNKQFQKESGSQFLLAEVAQHGVSEKGEKVLADLIAEFSKPKEKPADFGKRNVVATPVQQEAKLKKLGTL